MRGDTPDKKGEELQLAAGAKPGLVPTPETIRMGSVRMEQHPEYENTLLKIREAGFEVKITKGYPHVVVREVVNQQREIIRVEKAVYVQEGMRYLDLEHEVGHINQLTERFGEKHLPTERVMEYPDGRVKIITDGGGFLTTWQDPIAEYHNRLVEFLRLQERGADSELLKEHAKGLQKARRQYLKKGLADGKSKSKLSWKQKHFPDIPDLEESYREAAGYTLEKKLIFL